MADKSKTGLGSLPAGLLRPTSQPTQAPEAAEEVDGQGGPDDADDQGRGGTPDSRTPKPRRKRPPVSSATKGRKLHLPDEIHDRLWMLARQRRSTVSAVATELLDKALPRWTITREG